MQRVSNTTLDNIGRRCYAVAAAAMEGERSVAAATITAAAESGEKSKEIFWMRDPKTGNWIPENRFGEVHPVELRAQLLSNK